MNEHDPGDEDCTPVEIPMPRTLSKPRMEVVTEDPPVVAVLDAFDPPVEVRAAEDPGKWPTAAGHDMAVLWNERAPRPEAESAAPPFADRAARTTTDGKPPAPGFEDKGAPQPIEPHSGQHGAYWVLSPEERAKGWVRPLRSSYIHDGIPAPRGELRDLTREEAVRYAGVGYVKFEPYPESERPATGRFWTQAQIDKIGKGCGAITSMGIAIAETYAARPDYYGSTFCVGCRIHIPVGATGEFTWVDPRTRRPELRDGKPWRVGT